MMKNPYAKSAIEMLAERSHKISDLLAELSEDAETTRRRGERIRLEMEDLQDCLQDINAAINALQDWAEEPQP